MKKEEIIRRYGQEAYDERLKHKNEWAKANPEKIEKNAKEQVRKGGKHYEKHLEYKSTGIPGEKEAIRKFHGKKWRPYKNAIAPDSQIHHEWKTGTSEYRGVSLVEKDQHMHGYIDVIEILEGEITLFTEENIRSR